MIDIYIVDNEAFEQDLSSEFNPEFEARRKGRKSSKGITRMKRSINKKRSQIKKLQTQIRVARRRL